jgi:hypothetical protein
LVYAAILLAIVVPERDYTVERIHGLLVGDEINIEFPKPIPVHLTYQTAFVDDAGNLRMREDIYRHDERLLAALARVVARPGADLVAQSAGQPRAASKSFLVRLAHWLSRQKQRFGV